MDKLKDRSRNSPKRPYYTLADVANKYNELTDLKAVAMVAPQVLSLTYLFHRLIEKKSQELVRVVQDPIFVDIDQNGDVEFTETPRIPQKGTVGDNTFIVMFVNLFSHDERSHSNVLLFDRRKGRVYRFEPHGARPDHEHHKQAGFFNFYNTDKLDAGLSRLLKGWSYVHPHNQYPVLSQTYSRNDSAFNK